MSRFPRYRGYGLLLESEIELPELPLDFSGADAADVVIRRGIVPRTRHEATLNQELVIHIRAAFLIRDGRDVTVDPYPGADPAAIRVLLLGRVMAFLLRQRGWLPLHASGVAMPGADGCGDGNDRCVLFLGAPGDGKSTMAAALHQHGYVVITDDVGAVRITGDGQCRVRTAWSYVRLRADTNAVLGEGFPTVRFLQGDKFRYELGKGSLAEQYPVLCAYVMEYGDSIRTAPVSLLEAATLLGRYCFARRRMMDRASLERHLRDCSSVAGIVPVRRLIRPRSLQSLPEVVRIVQHDVAALG